MSDTPLKATFRLKLNGETIAVETVGQAYRFITSLSAVEWMEFKSLHDDARDAAARACEPNARSQRPGDLFDDSRGRRGEHEWAWHTERGVKPVIDPFSIQ